MLHAKSHFSHIHKYVRYVSVWQKLCFGIKAENQQKKITTTEKPLKANRKRKSFLIWYYKRTKENKFAITTVCWIRGVCVIQMQITFLIYSTNRKAIKSSCTLSFRKDITAILFPHSTENFGFRYVTQIVNGDRVSEWKKSEKNERMEKVSIPNVY